MKSFLLLVITTLLLTSCEHSKFGSKSEKADEPFLWENATVYFLLTDRFNNGDPTNDNSFGRKKDGAVLRSYEGGDLKGITQKIKQGYFSKLGVNAIWLTPHIEQIRGFTDEGTGKTYAYHGYWAADWTQVDPNLGNMNDMRDFVEAAHDRGIRVLLDVVINHTGPPTAIDAQWPDSWVRMGPTCTYKDAKTAIECVLVENLPDILTESDKDVELPPSLAAKWKAEGRYEQEVKELDEFFARTGLPRSPRHYIMKWHLDWIRDFGVDGFRVDTTKHTEAKIWGELKELAVDEFERWKKANPDKKISDDPFFLTGEVYGYGIQGGQLFGMGGPGEDVNFFENGFDSLINFSIKGDAKKTYEELFSEYDSYLNGGPLEGLSVMNYLTSHDDGWPFDKERIKPFEAATKLMLAPGSAQIYYGDETARGLIVEGTDGDATLRSFMNWDELENNIEKNGYRIADVYDHWAKLGQFRKAHVSVGVGVHKKLQDAPYMFKRTYNKKGIKDKVVVALDLPTDSAQTVSVHGVFADGEEVKDYYTGKTAVVTKGMVNFGQPAGLMLIGK